MDITAHGCHHLQTPASYFANGLGGRGIGANSITCQLVYIGQSQPQLNFGHLPKSELGAEQLLRSISPDQLPKDSEFCFCDWLEQNNWMAMAQKKLVSV